MTAVRANITQDAELRSLALTIARNQLGANVPLEQLLSALGYDVDEFEEIATQQQFRAYLEAYTKELQKSGFSFTAKARILAEDLLPDAYRMAKDIDMPTAVRMRMIENLVKWGDLEPKNTPNLLSVGAGFSITINLPNDVATPIKEVKGVEIEQKVSKKAKKSLNIGPIEPEIVDFIPTATSQTAPISVPVDHERVRSTLQDLFDEGDDYIYAGDDVHE